MAALNTFASKPIQNLIGSLNKFRSSLDFRKVTKSANSAVTDLALPEDAFSRICHRLPTIRCFLIPNLLNVAPGGGKG
jgi:hypothetical protein